VRARGRLDSHRQNGFLLLWVLSVSRVSLVPPAAGTLDRVLREREPLGSLCNHSKQKGVEVNQDARQFYAETYDVWMSDWPGEIDFYRKLVAKEVKSKNGIILDVACGTGRIGLRLAEEGTCVIGLDRSPEMLAIARRKSINTNRISWVEGDMRSFEIDKIFDLIMIPSHSFQNLNTPDDQAACIERIWQHLKPGGLLLMHLDHMNNDYVIWLNEISGDKKGVFEDDEQFKHPTTGLLIQTSSAWSFEPTWQTAAKQTIWEEISEDGKPGRRWETGTVPLHVVCRFEIEHLLKREGFEIEHIYGDFYRQELRDDSSHMIWLARKPNEHP
jgi:ubiquinone/menaquinone biosynthesis C-methylase UbiE